MSEAALFPASEAGGIDLRSPDADRLGYDREDMLRTAWLSEENPPVYRWTLHRAFGPGECLRFVMLNPSTADALVDDSTIVKCIGFATRLGFGSIDVVNLFPFRATKPPVMWAAQRAGVDIGGGIQGKRHLQAALRAPNGLTIAAWGANVRNDHERVQWLMDQDGADRLHCLSMTKRGEPGHPLMLPYSCLPIPWRPWAAPATTRPAAEAVGESEKP